MLYEIGLVDAPQADPNEFKLEGDDDDDDGGGGGTTVGGTVSLTGKAAAAVLARTTSAIAEHVIWVCISIRICPYTFVHTCTHTSSHRICVGADTRATYIGYIRKKISVMQAHSYTYIYMHVYA
jgi:hypothetical protein